MRDILIRSALRRLNSTDSTSFFDTANPITTNYDVWVALREATSSTPGKDIGIHVKGHQDDDTPLESLSLEAQMNIRMDTLAGECCRLHTRPLETKAHSGNQISLILCLEERARKLQQQLRSTFAGPLLQAYIQKKENWDDHIFSMIDWQAHGNYLASLPFDKNAPQLAIYQIPGHAFPGQWLEHLPNGVRKRRNCTPPSLLPQNSGI